MGEEELRGGAGGNSDDRGFDAGDVDVADPDQGFGEEALGDEGFDDEALDNEALDDEGLDDLDFARAETVSEEQAAAAGPTECTRCSKGIGAQYYQADGKVVCAPCTAIMQHGEPGDTALKRFGRALSYGAVAAALSALVWGGIRSLTGYEIGLIAVAVGLAVGFAVRAGSRQLGGWFYQTLAIALTYFAIVSTYVPELMEGIQNPLPEEGEASTEDGDYRVPPPTTETDPASSEEQLPLLLVFIIACVIAPFVPFLAGFENLIGLAIIAFALWEAWRVNKKAAKSILGPYAVAIRDEPG